LRGHTGRTQRDSKSPGNINGNISPVISNGHTVKTTTPYRSVPRQGKNHRIVHRPRERNLIRTRTTRFWQPDFPVRSRSMKKTDGSIPAQLDNRSGDAGRTETAARPSTGLWVTAVEAAQWRLPDGPSARHPANETSWIVPTPYTHPRILDETRNCKPRGHSTGLQSDRRALGVDFGQRARSMQNIADYDTKHSSSKSTTRKPMSIGGDRTSGLIHATNAISRTTVATAHSPYPSSTGKSGPDRAGRRHLAIACGG